MVKKINNKLILGIDPGYARVGWAVLKKTPPTSSGQAKNNLNLINFGCLETGKEIPHAERLKYLNLEIKKIIKKYKPKILAIEDLFFFKNLKTATKVAEARGVILMTGIENNLVIQEFTPLQIKQALVGYGRADKNQVQQMVKMILKLKEIPKPDDAADATAVAICSANTNKYE